MDVQPVVRQTSKGFALGCQHSGDNGPRWKWTVSQKTIAELWLMGIRAVPSGEIDDDKFVVYLYADSHMEAWHLWENKMSPLLLAKKMAETA